MTGGGGGGGGEEAIRATVRNAGRPVSWSVRRSVGRRGFPPTARLCPTAPSPSLAVTGQFSPSFLPPVLLVSEFFALDGPAAAAPLLDRQHRGVERASATDAYATVISTTGATPAPPPPPQPPHPFPIGIFLPSSPSIRERTDGGTDNENQIPISFGTAALLHTQW